MEKATSVAVESTAVEDRQRTLLFALIFGRHLYCEDEEDDDESLHCVQKYMLC